MAVSLYELFELYGGTGSNPSVAPFRQTGLAGLALTDTPGAGVSNDRELYGRLLKEDFGSIYNPNSPEGEFLRHTSKQYGAQGFMEALKILRLQDAKESSSELDWLSKNRRIGM